ATGADAWCLARKKGSDCNPCNQATKDKSKQQVLITAIANKKQSTSKGRQARVGKQESTSKNRSDRKKGWDCYTAEDGDREVVRVSRCRGESTGWDDGGDA
ncbi:hypothetical protein Tco_0708008, partial [Tanacetum coccineum]